MMLAMFTRSTLRIFAVVEPCLNPMSAGVANRSAGDESASVQPSEGCDLKKARQRRGTWLR